jgi:hypothetical protein
MFTMQAPLNLEFEPPISKIEQLSSNCVVLAAGNSLSAQEVTNRTRSKLETGKPAPISVIAAQLKAEYETFRDEAIEESIIRAAFGQDLVTFRSRGGFLPAYLQAQPGIYQQIVAQASQYNLGLDFIVAGVESASAHIFYVAHPGTLHNFDKLGHSSVGSGALHAAMGLSFSKQTPQSSLFETLFAVYCAKRAAEVAPGVGQETEMMVISSGGSWPCPTAMLEGLAKKYQESTTKEKPKLDDIEKEYAKQRQTS